MKTSFGKLHSIHLDGYMNDKRISTDNRLILLLRDNFHFNLEMIDNRFERVHISSVLDRLRAQLLDPQR